MITDIEYNLLQGKHYMIGSRCRAEGHLAWLVFMQWVPCNTQNKEHTLDILEFQTLNHKESAQVYFPT